MPKRSNTAGSAAPTESKDVNIIGASILGDDAFGKNDERGGDDDEGTLKRSKTTGSAPAERKEGSQEAATAARPEGTSGIEEDASGKPNERSDGDENVRLRHRLQQASYYAKLKATEEGRQQFNAMHRQRTARSRAKSQHRKLLEVERELTARLSRPECSFVEADAAQYRLGLTRAPDFHLSDRKYKEDIRAVRLENKILKYKTKLMMNVLTMPGVLDPMNAFRIVTLQELDTFEVLDFDEAAAEAAQPDMKLLMGEEEEMTEI